MTQSGHSIIARTSPKLKQVVSHEIYFIAPCQRFDLAWLLE